MRRVPLLLGSYVVRMHKTGHATAPESSTASKPRDPANEAYGAARAFLDRMGTLAFHARHKPREWRDAGGTFALAFLAWFELTALLTPDVRERARRAYPIGSPPIRLGRLPAAATLVEALSDEFGVFVRNTVFQDRSHPLEPNREAEILYAIIAGAPKAKGARRRLPKPPVPDTRQAVRKRLGVRTMGDAMMLIAKEWNAQDDQAGLAALAQLRCDPLDFDELLVLLDREAQVVLRQGKGGRRRRKRAAKDKRTSKPLRPVQGQEKWRRIQSFMIRQLSQGTLPTTLRATARQLKRRGATYDTVREATHNAPTLKKHFGLREAQGQQSSSRPAPLTAKPDSALSTLANEASKNAQRYIESLSPKERDQLEEQLEGMTPADRTALMRTLTLNPEAARTGDQPFIEAADRDHRRGPRDD